MAPLVDDGAFGDLIRSLAVLPFLEALAVVPRVALRREHRATVLTAASAADIAAGGGIAMSLAWAGAGAWSLVAQIVVQRLVECVALWAIPGKRIGICWSWRHFGDLRRALDLRAIARVLAEGQRHGVLMIVGLVLRPTAAGLYMLAERRGEALSKCLLGEGPDGSPGDITRRACRVALPTVLASSQLAVALPPILDLRWWGAVRPAQIALLASIPAALIFVRTACGETPASTGRRRVMQAMGAIVVPSPFAEHGLIALATVNLCWGLAVAVLWPWPSLPGKAWRVMLGAVVRPCLGAVAAGALLLLLADPVAVRLAAMPALCLLTASGWLAYLVIRGEPTTGGRPIVPAEVTPPEPRSSQVKEIIEATLSR
jgi:hypothetical protein